MVFAISRSLGTEHLDSVEYTAWDMSNFTYPYQVGTVLYTASKIYATTDAELLFIYLFIY